MTVAERMLEDHDNLVDNLLMWSRDSTNRLLFLERPDKFDTFLHPEDYLLVGASDQKVKLDIPGKHALIQVLLYCIQLQQLSQDSPN